MFKGFDGFHRNDSMSCPVVEIFHKIIHIEIQTATQIVIHHLHIFVSDKQILEQQGSFGTFDILVGSIRHVGFHGRWRCVCGFLYGFRLPGIVIVIIMVVGGACHFGTFNVVVVGAGVDGSNVVVGGGEDKKGNSKAVDLSWGKEGSNVASNVLGGKALAKSCKRNASYGGDNWSVK
jgi:hypothetical protein